MNGPRRWLGVSVLAIGWLAAGAGIGRSVEKAKFTRPPRALTTSEGVRIEFAVSAPTDVAVWIQDESGRVVRHLVAGRLGANAPSPLARNSLSQSVVWDGTDDRGVPVTKGPLEVHVGVGLEPVFDRFLLYEPDATPAIFSLAVGRKGEVYAFYRDPTANGNQGGIKVKVLDRRGHHLRQIMPFSAHIPWQRVSALGTFRDQGGKLVPRIHNWQTLSFYPDTKFSRHRSMPMCSLPAVDARGRLHWLVYGTRLASIDTADGGVPYRTFLSPPLLPEARDLTMNDYYAYGSEHPVLAVSEDSRYLYLAGLTRCRRRGKRKEREPLPCVLRVPLETRDRAEVFIGRLAIGGGGKKVLVAPRGVAAARGLLYVADPGADRVFVFDQGDGSLRGWMKVTNPQTVCVDPATGAVYVCAYTGKQTADLIKFDNFRSSRELYRMSLPRTGQSPNPGVHRAVLDDSSRPIRLWLPGIPYARRCRRLGYVEDTGEGFRLVDLPNPRRPWAYGPRDLYLDRKRGELYVKVTPERWYRIDERAAEVTGQVRFKPLRMASAGTQLVVDSSGNFVTAS